MKINVSVPIRFVLRDGRNGMVTVEAEGEVNRALSPEEMEMARKHIAIGALQNAKLPPDAPKAVREALQNALQRLKAEFN
jgi:hypothetical protein